MRMISGMLCVATAALCSMSAEGNDENAGGSTGGLTEPAADGISDPSQVESIDPEGEVEAGEGEEAADDANETDESEELGE